MLEELRAWLNGDREYFAGVVIYSKVEGDKALLQLFAKGKTDYCYQRLQQELLQICKQLKQYHVATSFCSTDTGLGERLSNPDKNAHGGIGKSTVCIAPNDGEAADSSRSDRTVSKELYNACKAEADKRYKEIMNLRAELFAKARQDDFTDPNQPDGIEQRSQLAVQVADGFKHVSELYDKADYVRLHGRLPADGETAGEELDVDAVPEHLVKQTLDNLRKNVSKMKKRPATPERIQLLQQHAENINKLEGRWRLLQPAK